MTEGTVTLIAGDTDTLLSALPVEAGSVRSRRIFAGAGARIARLAFDAGQVMAEHTATVPVLVQVLSGHAVLKTESELIDLPTGAIVHVDANLAHSVEALTPAHLLLILCERTSVVLPRAPKPRRPAGAAASNTAARPAHSPSSAAQSDTVRISNVVLASSGTDSDAIARVTARHAELSGTVAAYTVHILDAAAGGNDERIDQARDTLLDWCHASLQPLLDAEEAVLDPAIRGIAAELADRLHADRDRVSDAVGRLADRQGSAEIATAAVELRVQISHLLRSFDDHALPILAGTPGLPLASLWSQIETAVSDGPAPIVVDAGATCECGIVDQAELPELDVREVPHAIRHATVFGALDAVGSGSDGLILIAPHDPLPLLAQLEQRTPGRFTVDYLDRGPDAWRLRFSVSPVA